MFSLLLVLAATIHANPGAAAPPAEQRLLYVAAPGLRNYVEWGGKGVLVFDIDAGHRFVKRIASPFDDPGGNVENIKGICANAVTRRLYVSTIRRLACLDLVTEKWLWVKTLDGGCDRMALAPDGKVLYVPSLEREHWNIVDAATGAVIKKLVTNQRAHNTVWVPGGKYCYLAGLGSPMLKLADPATHQVTREVGPFSAPIRPYTVNASESRCYVNVNGLLGFEVGDLRSGKMLHRVAVPGFKQGPVKRHGCPSHGIGLTPDENEIWVVDAFNQRLHVFDNAKIPPRYLQSVALAVDQPGWVTFSIRGDFAYPSTGEVIDVKTRKIVARLKDEQGRQVQSEKLLEIDMTNDKPVRAGDQFGVGRAPPAESKRVGWAPKLSKPASDSDRVYRVKRMTGNPAIDGDWNKLAWKEIAPLTLEYYMGDEPRHQPKTQAKVAYDDDHMYLIWRVEDNFVLAKRTRHGQDVWNDSCVEFFFTPGGDSDSSGYFNLEANCGGAMLFGIHVPAAPKAGFTPEQLSKVTIASSLNAPIDPELATPTIWTLEYKVPLSLLEKFSKVQKPRPGATWRANFYKCAEENSQPHWLTWAPVTWPKPQFHLPQYFGTIQFE